MGLGKLSLALTAREITDLVSADLQRMEAELRLESVGSVEAVSRIARHLEGNGGKRLRPILLLISCRLFSEPSPQAIQLAAVVELIHTATLVHDDVIDAAETRRGKPSANMIWGNHTSVLAGDWLYMQAFQIALRQRNFEILDILITLTQHMVDGELLQLERIGRIGISEADSMELIDRKTASLFSACTRLGAHAAGASDVCKAQLAEFGWSLGMAFQMVDDILDFTSRESILGKPVGNDLREGKVTLPIIILLQRSGPEAAALIHPVLAGGQVTPEKWREIKDLLARHGAVDAAFAKAVTHATRAKEELAAAFPPSPERDGLISLADYVLSRDR